MKFYAAVWDSSERGLAHWKFGQVEAPSIQGALRRLLPYSRISEAGYEGSSDLMYDYDGDVAFISIDKGWVANKVSEAISEFDLTQGEF